MNPFGGVHCVLYALFDSQGRLDPGAMRAQVQCLLEHGIDGITVLGLATEVPKLNPREQRDMVTWISKEIEGQVPFSVTITGNSVMEQRAMIEFSLSHGADWLILQPPSVGTYSGDTYLNFFMDVAEGFDVAFAIQNAPQYLGRALTATDLARLTKKNPRFSIVKAECSATDLVHLIQSCGPQLVVMNGRGGLELTDSLRAGAKGFVLAPDAVDYSKKAFDSWMSGDSEWAERIYSTVLPSIVFAMQSLEHLICYGKRIFGKRTGIEIYDRSPALLPNEFGLRAVDYWARYLGTF